MILNNKLKNKLRISGVVLGASVLLLAFQNFITINSPVQLNYGGNIGSSQGVVLNGSNLNYSQPVYFRPIQIYTPPPLNGSPALWDAYVRRTITLPIYRNAAIPLVIIGYKGGARLAGGTEKARIMAALMAGVRSGQAAKATMANSQRVLVAGSGPQPIAVTSSTGVVTIYYSSTKGNNLAINMQRLQDIVGKGSVGAIMLPGY